MGNNQQFSFAFTWKSNNYKDHNAVTPVRFKPAVPRSRVKHSTTEPLRSSPFTFTWKANTWKANNLQFPFTFPWKVNSLQFPFTFTWKTNTQQFPFTYAWKANNQQFPPGRVAQSVTCLATDACLTADPGVASSIPARYHTFVEIDFYGQYPHFR